ncbi:flagellar assembly protein FliH [Halobacillus yeomjeoni]|uniref:flagellar assembly protein FliH n=1 Tax=Halobacillus yeomjeoni TaxID=311194 RepID=UPI001CD22802|nr:flagellar assembly protein FliH [Halobacillus yeomjeoni]MCA0983330.1 flagellar assembly protein FliH [Halobacillus yeomjeoni]
MSNQHSSSRVIKIKPIHLNNDQEDQTSLKDEIVQQKQEAQEIMDQADGELEQAREAAEKMLAEAEDQIKNARQNWEEERQNLVKEAKEEGYVAGLQQGKDQGYEEYLEKLSQANDIIGQAKEEHRSIVNASQESIAEIALRCAEKILAMQIQEDPQSFFSLVKKATKEVQDQPDVTIYVHPDQFETVNIQREELKMVTDTKTDVSILVKEDLRPMSCIIESPFGRVDAGIDSQLNELRQKIFEMIDEAVGHG